MNSFIVGSAGMGESFLRGAGSEGTGRVVSHSFLMRCIPGCRCQGAVFQ